MLACLQLQGATVAGSAPGSVVLKTERSVADSEGYPYVTLRAPQLLVYALCQRGLSHSCWLQALWCSRTQPTSIRKASRSTMRTVRPVVLSVSLCAGAC